MFQKGLFVFRHTMNVRVKYFLSLWAFRPLKRLAVYCLLLSDLDLLVTQYDITEELNIHLDRSGDVKTRTTSNAL
jgi:hypothetical protein